MKKTMIALLLLLITAPCMAQGWPDELVGVKVDDPTSAEVQMYLSEWNDQNPWGIHEQVGRTFYFGELAFDECDGVDTAFLTLDTTAPRMCSFPPWGVLDPTICSYWYPRDINVFYTLPWDGDAQAYIIEGAPGYWGTNVLALTVAGSPDTGVLQMGVMQLIDDEMVWDENYTWYVYIIEPRTAELRIPNPRRPKGRRR